MGLVFFKQGHFAQSIDIYRGLVERYNDDATLRVNLAMVLLKANLLQEAREELEQAIDINPDNQKAYRTMAVVLVKQVEKELAREYLAKAGISDPDRFVSQPPAEEEEVQPDHANQAAVPSLAPELPVPEPPAPEPPAAVPSGPSFTGAPEPPVPEPPAPEPEEEELPSEPMEMPFQVMGAALDVSMKGRVYTRLAGLVWMEGDLSFSTVRKRFNNEATKYLFGKGPRAMIMVEGKGGLHFRSERAARSDIAFQIFSPEEKPLYFLEEYVFAFCGVDTWENGRLAFKKETSLPIFHLLGPAHVVLEIPGYIEHRSLKDEDRFLLDVRRLVGWSGDLVPSLAMLGSPLPDGLWLELKGVGEVYYLTEPEDADEFNEVDQ
jgi:uncharacterized protein (AIM24 family)